MLLAAILLFALTRAEIIERMRAPVVTYADGLVKVYADCPEDLRREFQMPIARFAADTVAQTYRGLNERPRHFAKPGIAIHVGDVRTNRVEVYSRVSTNEEGRVLSKIYVKSPAHADIDELRLEILKGFFRAVRTNEVSAAEAVRAYRQGDPAMRIADKRQELEDWYLGKGGLGDEEALKRMHSILEPGVASKRDVIIFASRLYLYPFVHDTPLAGKYESLSFADAINFVKTDPQVRIAAINKSQEIAVLAGGRSEELKKAGEAYAVFLAELARGEKAEEEMKNLLEQAETKLAIAWEKAK